MMDRRSLLTAALIAPIVIAGPAVAGVQTGDPGLAQCIARYEAAEAAAAHYHDHIYSPAYEGWRAATDKVPHYTTKATWEAWDGRHLHMSSDCPTTCAELATHRRRGAFKDDDFGRCLAELDAGITQREARIASIREEWRIDSIRERSEQIDEQKFGPLGEVIEYPVKTVADLVTKMEFLQRVEAGDVDQEALLQDLRRIALS